VSLSDQNVVYRCIKDLKPYAGNARTHSKVQVRQIARSIETFGFVNPVLIGEDGEIIAGHGRVRAAELLGLQEVPTLTLSHLGPDQRRAYILADNKLAQNAGWDEETLAIELQALIDLDFDVELTGFSTAEIDLTLEAYELGSGTDPDPEDHIPDAPSEPTCSPGDLWELGPHRLLCGDALSTDDLNRLMDGQAANLIFTDPPYNVPIDGHVSGLGSIRHREFEFASGEMTSAEFSAFLARSLGNASSVCRDGAIAFVFMDWRHMKELLDAGASVFSELKNLCVWNKTNGGMGSFYRSKHELVFVFKVGDAPHINNFGLGEAGRYRTNVWDYPGLSSLGSDRSASLEMHPTVKPVALISDAIKDCTRRNDIVLDAFGGSGSTLIAAESCGRIARVIEIDPIYCDTIISRWEQYTGTSAQLVGGGPTLRDTSVVQVTTAGSDTGQRVVTGRNGRGRRTGTR